MSGFRQALVLGGIPIVVGLIYLGLQVAGGDPATYAVIGEGQAAVAELTGTIDPAGVILLIALGLAMGFGMLVILRGARDL